MIKDILEWWLDNKESEDDEDVEPFVEEIMQLPNCPACKGAGHLLPFSEEKKPYAYWVCSQPDCGYTIGRNMTAEYFYKGMAACEKKEKGDKKWKEFEF